MPGSTTTTLRICGLVGLAGAVLFFAGDMLFNGHFGSGYGYASDTLATVRTASLGRLFLARLVGPIAACLCMVGFWHVYLNVRPAALKSAALLVGTSFAFWVCTGAAHLLWAPKALATKLCVNGQPDCLALQQAIRTCWSLAFDLAALPGFTLALLLAWLVLSGRTCYPRWTVLANPALWIVLSPYFPKAPAPLGAILIGGSYNLPWILFFSVSVLTTWSCQASVLPPAQANSLKATRQHYTGPAHD